jgi:hypothetical protein
MAVIASLVGLTVGAIAYLAAWQAHGTSFCRKRRMTLDYMEHVRTRVVQHRAKHGRPPASLTELDPQAPHFKDAWGNDLVYEVAGLNFELRSLGADGRPGGSSLGADLYGDARDEPDWQPTLHEFVFLLPTRGVLPLSAAAGALSAVLTLILLSARTSAVIPASLQAASIGPVVISIFVTGVMSAGCAGFIMVPHLFSGH